MVQSRARSSRLGPSRAWRDDRASSPYFTDGVTTVGTPGQAGAYTILDLSAGFTGPLVYFSSGAPDMGFVEVYTVKVVQNWAGNNVFSIQAPGEDFSYNQPDLSFNAGDSAAFDVGDSSMTGYTLVFGTEIDNADTILGSPYVSQRGTVINLNLPSDYTGGAVYYFEDSSANMGYVEAPDAAYTISTPKKSNLKIYIDAQSDNRSGTSLTNLIDTANNATNVGDVTYYADIGGRGSYYLPYGQSGLNNASVILPDVLTSNPSNSLTSFTFSIYYYTTADVANPSTRLFGDTASLTAVWGHITNNINIGNGSSNLQFYTVNINTSAPSLNTWHHLCFTYDGTTTTLYINGVNVGTSTNTVNFVEPLLLGAYYPGTHNRGVQDQAHNVLTSFAGYYFDAVHVYDTVLTASEVTQLYNNPYVDTSLTVNVYPVTVDEVFFIDTGSGAQSKPEITFTDGEIYVFDQSDESNAGYPIVFGTTVDDTSNLYTTGVTVVGTPGQPGAYTRLDYTDSTALYYFSSGAPYMGSVEVYTVKVVQNWAGNNVFSIQAPGEDLFYDQPVLSFNAGDNAFFDVGDSTMSGYSLVFGTEIDNSGTILGSPYVNQSGTVINLNLPSDYTGGAVYYFENTNAGMGYVEEATQITILDPPLSYRTFSGSHSAGFEDSRLVSAVGWVAGVGSTLSIGNETNGDINIIGVKIMPRASGEKQHITKFTAKYSSDNITFYDIDNGSTFSTNFTTTATPYEDQESLNYFATPILAQYIQIKTVEFVGYSTLRAGLISPIATAFNSYTVTVSNEVFFIDTGSGAQSKPEITFTDGESYVFDQSDESNAGYPIVFGTTVDDTSNLYTTGATVGGTP